MPVEHLLLLERNRVPADDLLVVAARVQPVHLLVVLAYMSSSISFEASTHEATTLVALTHLQHPHRALVPDEGPLARVTVLRLLIAHLRVTVT